MINKLKKELKKTLSPKIFLIIINIWSLLGIYKIINFIKRKSFKKALIKDLQYKSIKFKFKIYPESNILQDDFIFLKNEHPEPEVLSIFTKHINNDACVIDIGANIGHHTIFLSKCVGEKGEIHCFEPIPEMVDRIKENITINKIKNIHVHNCALGNKRDRAAFFIDNNQDIGSSSLIKHRDKMQQIDVEIFTLDSFNFKKVDFIKIDVEGYEYNVFLGAQNTILKNKPKILFEYSPVFYEKLDKTHSKKIIDFLIQMEYKIFIIENKLIEVSNFEELHTIMKNLNINQLNIFCVHENTLL